MLAIKLPARTCQMFVLKLCVNQIEEESESTTTAEDEEKIWPFNWIFMLTQAKLTKSVKYPVYGTL